MKQVPSAEPRDLDRLSIIWDEVVRTIIEKMIEYSDPHISDIHINLREEMILELAKIEVFIAEKVVTDRLSGRILEQIDDRLERESCFNEEGLAKITKTAKNLAEHVWLKKYNERWKPKTETAIKNDASQKVTKLVPQKVEDNHFVPKSFIRRYWSKNNFIFRFRKDANGGYARERKAFGQWGFVRNLYSDRLEAHFGLLEGDATCPLDMLLKVEPLNRSQREALVGFIVIQRLRNPHFIESLTHQMKPIVVDKVGGGRENDPDYMRTVYETLFERNDFYDKIAGPVYRNQWVMVRSEDSKFILPDTCNIFGIHDGEQYVVMPITPNYCLVVLPFAAPEIRVVPHYINADAALGQDIVSILIANSKDEFLASDSFQHSSSSGEEHSEIMQRIIFSIAKIIIDK
jgi:hypothetical protein